MQYYLCFKVNKIPDLTMVKYSVYDISGQEDLIEKHTVFLRQLHRLGVESNVFFHLLYYYDGSEGISRGKRLQIIFYATAESPRKLELIREFVTTSVLSTYYDFYCYEVSSSLNYVLEDGHLQFSNLSNTRRNYKLSSSIKPSAYEAIKRQIVEDGYLYCEVQPGTNQVTAINSQSFYLNDIGQICCSYDFNCGAYLTKKDYHLYAQNRLYNDPQNVLIPIYSIMEWLPNSLGRLYNVLKLMEGYDETAALRVDIFPVDIAESYTDTMAPTINELRQRMSQHDQGKDDNCDTVLKSIENITKKLMKYPQFFANIVAFADHKDIAVMLVDSVGAEAVESGSYLVKDMSTFASKDRSYDIYSHDGEIIVDRTTYGQNGNYMSDYVSLYTLDEVRPMFSFPVLYPGETIECMKETDPEFDEGGNNTLYLGMSGTGYTVNFPVKLFKKHAFIAGVPGAGKTNTLLYMVSELWTNFHIPFLVLEPAKQEYRALAKASKLAGMEALKDICIFSPGADTKFPLHINPFEFPQGLTLAEHIANLNAVFAGAFELPPPSPHFIDTCIEQVYVNKGWNINSRNDGTLPYPTMQELYDSLNVAVQNSHYQGETLGNLRSVMEVRVGSLLKREIGNVYNVDMSSFKPEEWLDRPVIIELEALGEGPANFMALLISTLVRETLKVRKTMLNKKGRGYQVAKIIVNSRNYSIEKVDCKNSLGRYFAVDSNIRDSLMEWLQTEISEREFAYSIFDSIALQANRVLESTDVKDTYIVFKSKAGKSYQIQIDCLVDDEKPFLVNIYDNTKYGVNHVIFYEEAHNLVGPTQESIGDKVDPKVSATKFLVKMLAEVRALDEGIVIADQLPSVMAPEVLKNTGLKIGHRITANDDRELLGSTMSASADQLAEQSIYMPGEALVFYEGLLKPFKMQMAKWQKTTEEYVFLATDELRTFLQEYYSDEETKSDDELIEQYYNEVYDSPTDTQLHELIKDYPVYQELISRSMAIIVQRVVTAYSLIYSQLAALNTDNIAPAYVEGAKWLEKIQRYKRLYAGAKEPTAVLTDINKMEGQFLNPKSKFTELATVKGDKKVSINDKLKSIITESSNLFFNNISIVGNYGDLAKLMGARIMEAYLHVFECVDWKHLWGNDGIAGILDKSKAARVLIEQIIQVNPNEPKISDYYAPLRERYYQIRIIELVNEFNTLHDKLLDAVNWKGQSISPSIIDNVAYEFAQAYFKWMRIASEYTEHELIVKAVIIEQYCRIFDGFSLIQDIREFAHCLYEPTRSVLPDISKYVSWYPNDNPGLLADSDSYENLISLCRNFVRIEMHEIYYKQAKDALRRVMSDVQNDFALINVEQLSEVSKAYKEAYFKCFDLCLPTMDKLLIAENIDLFYSLITEVGINLQGSSRRYLNTSIAETRTRINDVRKQFYSTTVRDMWKKADAYWNS